jgi:hypothetical protein
MASGARGALHLLQAGRHAKLQRGQGQGQGRGGAVSEALQQSVLGSMQEAGRQANRSAPRHAHHAVQVGAPHTPLHAPHLTRLLEVAAGASPVSRLDMHIWLPVHGTTAKAVRAATTIARRRATPPAVITSRAGLIIGLVVWGGAAAIARVPAAAIAIARVAAGAAHAIATMVRRRAVTARTSWVASWVAPGVAPWEGSTRWSIATGAAWRATIAARSGGRRAAVAWLMHLVMRHGAGDGRWRAAIVRRGLGWCAVSSVGPACCLLAEVVAWVSACGVGTTSCRLLLGICGGSWVSLVSRLLLLSVRSIWVSAVRRLLLLLGCSVGGCASRCRRVASRWRPGSSGVTCRCRRLLLLCTRVAGITANWLSRLGCWLGCSAVDCCGRSSSRLGRRRVHCLGSAGETRWCPVGPYTPAATTTQPEHPPDRRQQPLVVCCRVVCCCAGLLDHKRMRGTLVCVCVSPRCPTLDALPGLHAAASTRRTPP